MIGHPKLGPVIAIDGPAGTGKSSVTRRLAELLHFVHIDTGALYRAVALLVLEEKVSENEFEKLATEVARSVHLEFKCMPEHNTSNRLFANGRDITDLIRTQEVSMAASKASAISAVRAALLGLQRSLGCVGKTILEGRDIGTVIFPDADVKFFLTASVDERAKRRLGDLKAAGGKIPPLEEVKKQIMIRDQGDSTRAVAPLKKAPDAIEVDTSSMTLDQVVQYMEDLIRSRLKGKI